MEQSNPESEVMNVVDKIENGNRADAINAINDMLFSKAADAMASYKQVVAKTFFDEPAEALPDATDNGTN